MAGSESGLNPYSDPSVYGLPEKQRKQAMSVLQRDPQPAGPLKKLYDNPYKTGDLRFPIDLSTNNYERLHYVTFYVNVQEKSKYSVKEETTGAQSAANANRFADTLLGIGQVSGTTEAVGLVGQAIAAGAMGAGGAKVGFDIAQEKGAIAGGILGGAIGTAIVKSIDLSRKTKRIKSTISLYMPDTVVTTSSHGYNGVSMTGALGMVGALGQGASAVGTSISEYFKKGGEGANPNLAGAGTGSMAELGGAIAEKSGAFGEGIKEAVLFSAGLAQNPQIEILYQQTEHRTFTFTFKMIPRNAAEAQAIRDIIKEFRFHSAPELLPGAQGRFFIPPAEFDIKFFYNGKENQNINRISTCVLTRVDVNYASAGQWTTFDDGMPVETTMQLEFQELELMHKQRIAEGY